MSNKKLINFGPNDPVRKMLQSVIDKIEEDMCKIVPTSDGFKLVKYEVHADGVKEVPEECPFCEDDPCNEPHCPYTEEE